MRGDIVRYLAPSSTEYLVMKYLLSTYYSNTYGFKYSISEEFNFFSQKSLGLSSPPRLVLKPHISS
jgi:hypothetical protein